MVKKTSISNRVFVLSSIISLIFLILFSFIVHLKNREKKLIFDASKEQFNNEVNAVLKLYSEAINQVTFDYTFWDDFVDNIEDFDPTFPSSCKQHILLQLKRIRHWQQDVMIS